MASKYPTIQQHEPLRVPEGWDGDRRRLIAQLEEIFDDIYRRFGRLGLSDLDKSVANTIRQSEGLRIEVFKAIEDIDEFHGTTVEITDSGVDIKTGGTFTVDSEKFDIDENGEMSAVNARISGQLAVDENDVWHKGILVVSTATPKNPQEGMIWVKPDTTSIPAAGTWTAAALASRPWKNNYAAKLSGTSIGSAPGSATYTYEVSVPVYYNYNSTSNCTCTVYLGSSSGGKDIAFAAKTYNHDNAGGNIYKASVTSTKWLGNADAIYMLVVFSDGGAMTVNSHTPFSCTLTAKTTSAAGWKPCEVQMYAG